MPRSPFHLGEHAVQSRVGVRDKIEAIGRRILRDAMPDQHRDFFAELPFLLVGSLDAADRPWASILHGRPGFARSPDPETLEIDARPVVGDPALLEVGAPVGVLGIQLETRRRNRMNGRLVGAAADRLTIHVDQSFGNCPQYIHPRTPVAVDPSAAAPSAIRPEAARLSPAAAALIRAADTFFVATASANPRAADPTEGIDVSHRGGPAGFIEVATAEDDRTVLTWPDYRGNFLFNTLGNLAVNPRAGALFIDFATGDLLSLTGDAQVLWGTARRVELRVTAGVHLTRAVPLRWALRLETRSGQA